MKKIISSIALMGALMGQAQETNTVEQTVAPTNVVAHATAPSNTVTAVTASTNTVAATTQSASTNTVTATAQMTDAEKAFQQELIQQIPEDVAAITNGLSAAQLVTLCIGMHMEPKNGTHDIMVDYWKAANAGLDVTRLGKEYTTRHKEQGDFMRTCQEAMANANLNKEQTFTLSGVEFDVNSTNLVKNLLAFRSAKESGKMSMIVDGRPFSIVRTQEEEKMFRRVFDRDTQQFRLIPKRRPRQEFRLPKRYRERN